MGVGMISCSAKANEPVGHASVEVFTPKTTASPTPSPSPTPKPSPSVLPIASAIAKAAPADGSNAVVMKSIVQVFGKYAPEAFGVFDCESGDHDGHAPYTFGVKQISATNDYGVAQIHDEKDHRALAASLGYAWSQMLEVIPNLRVAWAIFKSNGYKWSGQWTCSWAAAA